MYMELLNAKMQEGKQYLLQSAAIRAIQSGELAPQHCAYLLGQYKSYVDLFPILLSIGLTKLESDEARMPLVLNLWEEHGAGDPRRNHRALYAALLEYIATSTATSGNALRSVRGPAIERFRNQCKDALCQGDAYFAMGFLGPGTEEVTTALYTVLQHLLTPFGGAHIDTFFALHCEADVEHAAMFRTAMSVLLGAGKTDGEQRMCRGLEQAINLEIDFWNSVLEEARLMSL
jgi:hypothetical protein